MIVLSGASASGKTEVAKLLAKKYGITKVITTTTRSIRQGEIDGKDYFFVSKDVFGKMMNEDKFVETTIYNNNFYGSTKDQVADDKCIVTDASGLRSYIALQNKNIITFFLRASENTRYERMLSRGDPIEKAKERIIHDKIAFSEENLPQMDFYIDNEINDLESTADEIYQKYIKAINKK